MCLKVHSMIWAPNQSLKFRTLNVESSMPSRGALEAWNPKRIPKLWNPKRWVSTLGLWFSSGGCIVSLGQTKAPVGNFSGAMLNFGWVNKKKTNKSWATFKTLTWHEPLNPDWFGFQDPYSGLWNKPYIAGDCIPSPTYTAQLVMPALLNFLHRANHAHGCSCPHQCFPIRHEWKTVKNKCFFHVLAAWQQILHKKN